MTEGLQPTPAHVSVLERVLAQSGVETRLPEPPWSEYIGVLAEALGRSLREFLAPLAKVLGAQPELVTVFVWGLLLAVGVALIYILFRAIAPVWRGRTPSKDPEEPRLTARARPEPERDREAWRRELEARLARGQAREALSALWWWLALSVCRGTVDHSWTSRDLVQRAERRDLDGFTRVFDRLAYSPKPPRAEDVRRLLADMEAVLS